MKILVSTPLFPPEVAYPAKFSKNFAKHLADGVYDVVVATFSDFPEKTEGVNILYAKKSHNLFIRLLKFYWLMLKVIPKVDLVILIQAGFSSFLTLLAVKIFRKRVVLKMKEDEASIRKLWRVRKLQQFIFKNVDFILFENEVLKEKIISEYNLSGINVGVLEHPNMDDVMPYETPPNLPLERGGNNAQAHLDIQNQDWKNYTEKFLSYAK